VVCLLGWLANGAAHCHCDNVFASLVGVERGARLVAADVCADSDCAPNPAKRAHSLRNGSFEGAALSFAAIALSRFARYPDMVIWLMVVVVVMLPGWPLVVTCHDL